MYLHWCAGFENSHYQQAVLQTFATMCKVPLLFVLTLLVTFPSLYVFNALVGSRLTLLPVLKLLVASLAVNLAVLASLGPILAFFSMSTPNYSFIVLLNVLLFTIAGTLGLIFLVQTLNRLTISQRGELPVATGRRLTDSAIGDAPSVDATQISEGTGPGESVTKLKQLPFPAGPLDQLEGIVLERHVRKVFACWMIVFGLVAHKWAGCSVLLSGLPAGHFNGFALVNQIFLRLSGTRCRAFWEVESCLGIQVSRKRLRGDVLLESSSRLEPPLCNHQLPRF